MEPEPLLDRDEVTAIRYSPRPLASGERAPRVHPPARLKSFPDSFEIRLEAARVGQPASISSIAETNRFATATISSACSCGTISAS